MARPIPAPPSAGLPPAGLVRLIGEIHLRLTGRPLLQAEAANDDDLAEALWTAPRAVVAHGTQADPIFCYGNRMALELFEMVFAAFTALPSRFSAGPVARGERASLSDRVSRDPLTGLANRAILHGRLSDDLSHRRGQHGTLTGMFACAMQALAQHGNWRQLNQVFRNTDGCLIQLKKFNLLSIGTCAEDQADRRLFTHSPFMFVQPAQV